MARRLYYEKKLVDAKSNTHATWKILNEILNRKKAKYPVEIANRFCNCFSSIGPNLAKGIQSLPSSYIDYQSIFFNPTTKDKIIAIAQSFASGKTAGYDNNPMSLIK